MATSKEAVRLVRHGAEVELQVGTTCASWQRPGQVLTGSVWDALALPCLLLGQDGRPTPRSALILGLGGGSVARILRACHPKMRIVGVDKNPDVVRVARKSLGLDKLGIEVDEALARAHPWTGDGLHLEMQEDAIDHSGSNLFEGGAPMKS